MGIEEVTSELSSIYAGFIATLPPFFQVFFNLFFLSILVFAGVAFIWMLHRFISTKNILDLDLNKYNTTEHPVAAKLVAGGLYFLEYIVIMPCLVFFWFVIFGFFLLIFTNLGIDYVLLVPAVTIGAIRITAYYKESVARELAKLLPLNLLGVSLLVPGFFSFSRVISNLNQIPTLSSTILNYLLFIVVLEIILRFFELVFALAGINREED